jgi:hypothetical protein
MTFDNDEWRSITFDGGAIDYLRPVNEHWSTFPLLLYRATFALFELRSHLPYQLELVALHLLAVTGAYALMRQRIGPLPAALVSLPLLLLGAGAENLYWAFQTGFIGSVVFGLWALFFLELPGRRAAIAAVLLVTSLASSGVGVFFVFVAFWRVLVDPRLRGRMLAVAVPAATYLFWFAVFGRHAVGVNGPIDDDPSAGSFAVRGIVYAAEHASGLDHLPGGHMWGLALVLVLAALTVVSYVRGGGAHLAAACLLGLGAMYVVIAFMRADLGREFGTESRYVYVAAFLLALAAVDLASEPAAVGSARTRGVTIAVALLLGVTFATWANVDNLVDKRSFFQYKADVNRAFVGLAISRGSEGWVDPQATVGYMPAVPVLVRTVQRHGSPLQDEFFPSVATIPGKAAEEFALLKMAGRGFRTEPSALRPGYALSQIHVVPHARGRSSGKCVNAPISPEIWVMRVPPSARVRVRSSDAQRVRVDLAHEGGPPRPIAAELEPNVWTDVVVPDIGDQRRWVIGLASARPDAAVDVCMFRPVLNSPPGGITVRP